MCFPGAGAAAGAAASLGLGVASSLASFGAQQQQYSMEEQRYNENYQDALADNRATETSLLDRQMQEQQAYAQKDSLAATEGATKAAQVRVAAASNGVAGPVVGDLVNAIGQQINDKRATLETNWQNTASQIQSQKTAAVSQEESRINEVANPVSPSIDGTLLTIGGDALKAAGSTGGQAGLSAAGLNLSM